MYRDVADAQNIHLCTWRFLGICYQDQVLLGLQNAAICIHLHWPFTTNQQEVNERDGVVTVNYEFWQVMKVMTLGKSTRLTRAAVSTPISNSHHTAEDNLALFSRS